MAVRGLKRTWMLTLAAATLIVTAIACSKKQDIVEDTQPAPVVKKPTVVAAETLSIATLTRFKNTTGDKTGVDHDGKTVCNVPEKTIVKLKEKAKLVADNKHVFVTLAEPMMNCQMTEGYFFGPHLLGTDWLNRVDQNSRAAPIKGAAADPSEFIGVYNSAWGQKIAGSVNKRLIGSFQGRCYEYVAYHFEDAGIIGYHDPLWDPFSVSAYQFADWAIANSSTLKSRFGLKYEPSYNSRPQQAPVGTVLVYQPGQCGYNATHGHIEIVVSPNKACSDACQTIASVGSGCKPHVFLPVGK